VASLLNRRATVSRNISWSSLRFRFIESS
jgi:hypothetical protein